jgi:hypothetical protein
LGPTKGLRTTMSRQAPRYMHSKTSGHCEKFYFQGCGRNSNNFYAKEACRETCEEEGAENEEDAAFFTKIADLIKNNYENKKKPWYERCRTCEEEGAGNEEDAAFFTKIADLIKNYYENKKKLWYERCNGQHPC